jgi:hypothetical protein
MDRPTQSGQCDYTAGGCNPIYPDAGRRGERCTKTITLTNIHTRRGSQDPRLFRIQKTRFKRNGLEITLQLNDMLTLRHRVAFEYRN